ncbi:MAG TPA: GNAT family N-acetyltransferase [Clostridia bacterium]|nr:GNAT family N-acetyltransferase [Clostridia bacterium]
MPELFDITYDEIDIIKDLWEKNREYHENTSEYFKEVYKGMNFDQRIKGFSVFDEGSIKITVAKDNGEYVGYCISTAVDGKGEVESVHVEEGSRGAGIGGKLVKEHIEWMRHKNCSVIGVTVSQENTPTIGFYRKLGFFPNTLYMQQK